MVATPHVDQTTTASEVLTAAAQLVDRTCCDESDRVPLNVHTAINLALTDDPYDCGIHRSTGHATLALAGMRAVYAALGYRGVSLTLQEWGAQHERTARELIDLLLLAAEFADCHLASAQRLADDDFPPTSK